MAITLKFDERFKTPILTRQIRQTIRLKHSHDYNIGELVYMEFDGITLWAENIKTLTSVIIDPENEVLFLDGIERIDSNDFAIRDGFKSFHDLCEWIGNKYGYELFHGVAIGW